MTFYNYLRSPIMKWKLLIPVILLSIMGLTTRVSAHGVAVEHRIVMTPAIEINATYDSGEPMANAQIAVYAPNDPATPWLQGMADQRGRFIFVPDRSQVGSWDVKVRKAGHGDLISIPFVEEKPALEGDAIGIPPAEEKPASEGDAIGIPPAEEKPVSETAEPSGRSTPIAFESSSGYSALQKWVMAMSIIWGFVGTALFFSRNKTHAHS